MWGRQSRDMDKTKRAPSHYALGMQTRIEKTRGKTPMSAQKTNQGLETRGIVGHLESQVFVMFNVQHAVPMIPLAAKKHIMSS